MHIPPRYIAIRLVILAGVLAWAWWKMSSPGAGPSVSALTGEAPEPPTARALLDRPVPAPPPAGLPGTVDPLAFFDALTATAAAAEACGASGVELTVSAGPGGLQAARLEGAGLATLTDPVAACVTAAVEARAWPAGVAPSEGTIPLGAAP